MNKILIFSLFIFSWSGFAQESEQTQKSYTRKRVFNKYVTFGGFTLLNSLKNRKKVYQSFIKRPISTDVPKLEKQSKFRCHEVCPNNLGILKINQSNYEKNEKNSLSFLNEASHFEGIMKKEYGFCWGHSSLTNQLRHLAFFDPDNSFESIEFQNGTQEWRNYIKKALRDIFHFRPRILPFLSSIRELSEFFEDDLKKLVIDKWANNAISISNYFKRFSNNKKYSRDELRKKMKELETRLKRGETPEILFAVWNSDNWIHVTLVTEVLYNEFDYTYKLTLDDNRQFNNISEQMDPSEIIIDLKDQSIQYPKGPKFGAVDSKIGRLEITKTNTIMYNEILPRLVNFCKIKTGCLE